MKPLNFQVWTKGSSVFLLPRNVQNGFKKTVRLSRKGRKWPALEPPTEDFTSENQRTWTKYLNILWVERVFQVIISLYNLLIKVLLWNLQKRWGKWTKEDQKRNINELYCVKRENKEQIKLSIYRYRIFDSRFLKKIIC